MIARAVRGSGVGRLWLLRSFGDAAQGFERWVQGVPAYKHEKYVEFSAKYDTILQQDTKKYEL
jgi:hypothetical protein